MEHLSVGNQENVLHCVAASSVIVTATSVIHIAYSHFIACTGWLKIKYPTGEYNSNCFTG